MIQKRIISFTFILLVTASTSIFLIEKANAMAADCSIEPSTENYIGVRYKALLVEDELSETGWVLLFCGSGVTMNGEYQPHFIELMIKAGWTDLYDDGLCAAGFPSKRETRKNFTIHFQLSDYEDGSRQDNDIAAWTQDPKLFPRYFTNIDSEDPKAPDMISAEYQIDKGGYLEGREIEVSLERGEVTRLPADQNYFMDPDSSCKPNSQADILYREWIATLRVPSLNIDSSVHFYVNTSQGDRINGNFYTLNLMWENPGRPIIESDRFKVIIFDPEVKTISGEWRKVTRFLVDYRTPRNELPLNEKGQLVGGYRKVFYKGKPAVEASFGYGCTNYVIDGDPTNYEPSDATKAVIDLQALPPAKLLITPSSFTMNAGITYSHLEIGLLDANNLETTSSFPITVSLSTTSPDGEFRQFGTTIKITNVIIPSGESSVNVDYYDIKDGTQTLTVSATGLTPRTATARVIPDIIPPVTTITVGALKCQGGTTLYVAGSTSFTLSAMDNATGVNETKYRVDGGSWSTYTASFTLSSYSDGSHIIGYYSIDRASNNETEKTLTVQLDNTNPTISNASPTGSLFSSASVTFAVKVIDAGSGVKEVNLIVDGTPQGSMREIGGTYAKTMALTEGGHSWSVEAVDNVGNTATQTNTFTLQVDTTPPSFSGLSAPSNPVFGVSTAVSCQVSDAASGVREVNLYYSTNGGSSWNKITMTFQGGLYAGLIPSQMFFTEIQYYVEAVDNAGNKSQTPIGRYSVGIPVWLYLAIVAIVVIVMALLLKRTTSH